MTSSTFQQEVWEQKKKLLKERISTTAVPLPPKCPSCGYHKCQCLCDPNCPDCGGSGYLKAWNPEDGLQAKNYGGTRQCPKMRANQLKKSLALGEGQGGLTANEIQTLDWQLVQPGISDGIKALKFVRPAVQRGYGMGIMLGTFGQAKTLLMKIAVAVYIRQGKKAFYVKLTDMLDDIRTAYDVKEEKMQALSRKVREWNEIDLLCLDEIDKSSETEWARDRLFNLCDERYMRGVRRECLTLFAANYDTRKDIPGYLRSRIEDNRFAMIDDKGVQASFVVLLSGPDGRKSMPENWTF